MGEFVALFTGMGLPAIIFLCLGIIFLIIEAFISGFGIFGISGTVCLVAGVIFRIVDGTTWAQILYLLALLTVLLIIIFSLGFWSLKSGWLSKTPLVQNDVAVPTNYSDPELVYGFLIGKIGTIEADCRPVGDANIEGKTYQVLSQEGFIIKGANVIVIKVEGEIIFVKKYKG